MKMRVLSGKYQFILIYLILLTLSMIKIAPIWASEGDTNSEQKSSSLSEKQIQLDYSKAKKLYKSSLYLPFIAESLLFPLLGLVVTYIDRSPIPVIICSITVLITVEMLLFIPHTIALIRAIKAKSNWKLLHGNADENNIRQHKQNIDIFRTGQILRDTGFFLFANGLGGLIMPGITVALMSPYIALGGGRGVDWDALTKGIIWTASISFPFFISGLVMVIVGSKKVRYSFHNLFPDENYRTFRGTWWKRSSVLVYRDAKATGLALAIKF